MHTSMTAHIRTVHWATFGFVCQKQLCGDNAVNAKLNKKKLGKPMRSNKNTIEMQIIEWNDSWVPENSYADRRVS